MLKHTILIAILGAALASAADEQLAHGFPLTPLSTLEHQAKDRSGAKARIELAGAPETPNYLLALNQVPKAVQPFEHLVHAALFTGGLDAEVKMAMGIRVSQLLDAPYVSAHMEHLIGATERGRALLNALRSNSLDSLPPPDRLAIDYSEWLTQDVHGVTDADFHRVRAYYNDSQIVELTTTTCFFNYFGRFTQGLRLPVEPWVLQGTPVTPDAANQAPIARVALISDEEVAALQQARSGQPSQAVKNALGLGFANSMRAMYLAPDMALAWAQFGTAVREYDAVNRGIKLQVSFAVSMANNCRYCTLHQVLGLKRLGVSTAKLMQMRKDDSQLTSEELIAVTFARQLTREPWIVADTDYRALETQFGKQGALEVLLQTCTFAYMNHFTDGLRLPSEDEAVRTYREIYGDQFQRSIR